MKKLLSQNSKMKKSMANSDKVLYNFGIPAFRSREGFSTCPNAGTCASGCYAQSGTYRFKNVASAYESRLTATFQDNFSDVMNAEINLIKLNNPTKKVFIRIHDSGDFYSLEYFNKWVRVMALNSDVTFYAYTKQVAMFKAIQSTGLLPENFTLIFSFGGKQDNLIDVNNDRHSLVFEDLERLQSSDYINASDNDFNAIGENKKIGLVFHHKKSYKNTAWNRVKVEGVTTYTAQCGK